MRHFRPRAGVRCLACGLGGSGDLPLVQRHRHVAEQPPTNCRLRAIPDGVDLNTDYLGAYTGPILYTDAFGLLTDGGKAYSYVAQSEEGDGAAS